MKTILYVNHGLGRECGVYDFGKRHAEVLVTSSVFSVVYVEPNSLDEYVAEVERHSPDVVIFNYMELVLPWVNCGWVREQKAKKVVVQHLYDPTTVSGIMSGYGALFDYMICLDPSLVTTDGRVFPMHRPIPTKSTEGWLSTTGTIQVGSFGFGLPHKQFHLIAREVNRCFDDAVFNLHMTVGRFTGDYTEGILAACRAEITKPGVSIQHTSGYLDEDEIVSLLSKNHINALFYALDPSNAGLSSALDYLIAANRPILLSDCESFKHAREWTYTHPEVSLSDIVENYQEATLSAEELYVWHNGKLLADMERMLEAIT